MKKILNGIAILLVAIGAGYGITHSLGNVTPQIPNIALQNVEALGDGEQHDRNGFWLWFSQGTLQDEQEMEQPCPTESNTSGKLGAGGVSVEGAESQKNPTERTDVRCRYGYSNCSRVRC